MKSSAPTPAHTYIQTEAPALSFGVIRTAFIGTSFVMLVLIGLFCFFRARTPSAPSLATPRVAQPASLRVAAVSSTIPSVQ
jgi:hypothetical protein